MQNDAGIRTVLQALSEPAVLSDPAGCILHANTSALKSFGNGAASLPALCLDQAAALSLQEYLRRCSGVAHPLPGAATLMMSDNNAARFRISGCVLKPSHPAGGRVLFIRLTPGSDERFAALSAKVHDLNQEIRVRRHAQMRLEAALQERELLLRELHHRVKNNIGLLTGILDAARRDAAGRDGRVVLAEVTQRMQAVAAVHQMLHLEGSMASVSSTEFISALADLVMKAAGQNHLLAMDVQEMDLSNDIAVPAALALNELLTNAVKYGASQGGGASQIQIKLSEPEAGTLELAVIDNGPGFQPDEVSLRRGSGLGLVHGLARQIGGTFSVRQGKTGGVECILQFRARKF